MDVIDPRKEVPSYKNLVVSLGNFDGIHLGHRQLVEKTIQVAEAINGTSAVLTFDPHPLRVINPDKPLPLLLTKEDKIQLFSQLGISLLVVMDFSFDLSYMAPKEFVNEILAGKLGAKKIVIGYNYSFGHKGAGNAETMAELSSRYGIETIIVPPVQVNGTEVSSTVIRGLFGEGRVEEAADLLGYRPFIKGVVVHGEKRGRTIGFPTANIDLPDGIVVPAGGVYVVKVTTQEDMSFFGVANIGSKPTFHNNHMKNLEIHILDFTGDLYGKIIKTEFLTKVRDEKKFSSVDQLMMQILEDTVATKNYISMIEHKQRI